MSYSSMPADRDPELWKTAKKRAAFKYHLGTYIVVNIFLWLIWFFTNRHESGGGWPWPVWPTLGWGVGLLFNFLSAYVYPKNNAVEREYDKLKRDHNQQS